MVEIQGLQLFDYNPLKPELDFRCGNNKFSDNIWDFNGFIKVEHLSGKRLMVDFEFIIHKPKMLEVIKWFIHHELTTGKFSTAKRSLDGVVRFVKFINEYAPEVESFSEIDQFLLEAYFKYLPEARSETSGELLSHVSIKKSALAIKDILLKGNIKGWDVPKDVRFVQSIYNELIINNKALKKDAKQAEQVNIDKISDEELIDQMLRKAISDLDKNENILVAASVVIGLQLGLRISEIITMYNASIEQIGGETKLVYSTGKLQAEPTRVYKPANALVVQAITKVEEYTAPLRKESGLPYLFLNRVRNVKGYPVGTVSHANWSKNFLRPWLQKHNLRDKNGNIADFSSHTFRHACATYALRGGASIETIRELLNHKSIRGTQHYTHLLQEDVRNKFAKVFNEGAVLVGKQALQIKDRLKVNNPFKGKTIEQVDKLRKAHKIQILSHGLCLHHPMRNEPCEGDGVCLGCHNFLTTPDFLEVHRGRLQKIRAELAIAPAGGPYEAKLKTIEKYLVGIIDELESQMNYAGNDNNSDYSITPSEWEGIIR
ncbi:site-specific integrase [Paenibacillus naphthalenovorans]|uniref:site-specific integrase n=1 Tax=Paenibacillus naphthalenovorans TaxID=162209 RepID=UPI000887DFDC|nr:site-specific integrase [Paenibacillus naphthalenovorans]SDJ43959.1 Phage integrase family protein [Paenibacillus naphthalenovorans]